MDKHFNFARCWKITRNDGKVFSFTDHDFDIEFEGQNYLSNPSLDATALEKELGLNADNLEIQGIFDHGCIEKNDVELGLFELADVIGFEINWRNKTQKQIFFVGKITHTKFTENRFQAEIHSPFDRLNNVFGRGFHRECDAEVGDHNCKYLLSSPQAHSTLNIIDFKENIIWVHDVSDYADRWFENGSIEISYDNNGLWKSLIKSDVKNNGVRKLTLWKTPPFLLSINAVVKLIIGCDKTINTCASKFNNARNFCGFPYIPDDDWLKVVEA